LFNRFATYNGSNPYEAPAMLSMIPHLEQNEGTFYPQGGMISITNALYNLALKLGVQFHFSTPIEKIIHENGKVTGVIALGKNHSAPLVITNSDVFYLYNDLIQQPKEAAKTLKRERSSSALIFYWGMKKEFPQLLLHNIFFTENYAAEFKNLFETKTMYPDPTVYVNITAKQELGQAPLGKENWFVMINAPADEGQDWNKIQQEVKKSVIQKLSKILGEDIGAAIETEHILNPKGIESETKSYKGSLYGTSSNSTFAAFLRHTNFSTTIEGLFCTGGSVHPGGGIPLSLKSAKIVSELID
jgi:phytoene desaturase